MTPAPVMPILFGGLIAWSLYRRVRRNIGRQKLQPRRITISIIILGVVSLLILSTSLPHPPLLFGFGGGLLLGVLLGMMGLRFTRFEMTDEGHFYTPNTHIGIALSVLLVGRLLYRFWVLRDVASATSHPPPMQSPLTFFIFGLIVGYYIAYRIGLFVHTRDKK
jgi:drug/metabolite transporter (DMT)-like permease